MGRREEGGQGVRKKLAGLCWGVWLGLVVEELVLWGPVSHHEIISLSWVCLAMGLKRRDYYPLLWWSHGWKKTPNRVIGASCIVCLARIALLKESRVMFSTVGLFGVYACGGRCARCTCACQTIESMESRQGGWGASWLMCVGWGIVLTDTGWTRHWDACDSCVDIILCKDWSLVVRVGSLHSYAVTTA